MGPVMAEVDDGRNPNAGVFHNVTHLQHGGADALRHQAAPFVFPEAHHCKSHHLGAAARYRGSAGPIP